MNVREFNQLLLRGEIDREDMWPRLTEFKRQTYPFFFEFGLKCLPNEPGLLIIRGPRQYGKSTWLDQQIVETIETFGKGSALYLNGDEIVSNEILYEEILRIEKSFPKSAQVRRLFIDEITSVKNWERAIKRLYDQGEIRRTLIITTGSSATDLRRGTERLPGRKGKLDKTEYIFLPISYHQFYKTCGKDLEKKDIWKAYLIAGGAPLACSEIVGFEKIPEYFIQLVEDWVIGEIVGSGRNRLFLNNILRSLYRFAGSPVGFAKLARETGLANNSVAAGYIEQLSDLFSVLPIWAWDTSRQHPIPRKPCKFGFINMAAAIAFMDYRLRMVHDFNQLPKNEQSKLIEWTVLQEIWRRRVFENNKNPEEICFWQSKTHELDFVVDGDNFYEVKLGKASPLEFTWFTKVFPKKFLTVICSTPFETDWAKGVTLHQFLMEGPCLDFIRNWDDPFAQ